MILHRDYETRSTVDLRKVGAHVYAQHPTTDVIVAVFVVEQDDGSLLEPWIWRPGEEAPPDVDMCFREGSMFAGHNSSFEQAIDRYIMGPRYGFPIIPDERIDCTLARCAIQAIPLDLARACQALNLKHVKDEAGHKLMLKMCKPKTLVPLTWHETPEQIARLTEYCIDDVMAEIGLGKALRPMTPEERQVWLLDQTMNNRGVNIDMAFVDVAAAVALRTSERLHVEMNEVTGGMVPKTTQVAKLREFAKSHGIEFQIVDKVRRSGEEYEAEAADREALEDLLDGELPPAVRRAFEIRLQAGKASVKKLAKFQLQRCDDGTAKGNLQYHGAAPGRWAGRGIQLHNMIRKGVTEPGGWDAAFRDMQELSDDMFELVWGSPLDVISRMSRGAVIARPGRKLYFADYSSVEARGAVWAAGQKDQVELFANGGKIYEQMGSAIFGLPWEEVLRLHETKEDIIPRFVGKETVLGCGYGIGANAFQRNCKKKGKVILPFTTAYQAVHGWREKNWRVVEFWRELEDAAKASIETPGAVFRAGPYSYRCKGAWLQCRLPSGRVLWYRRPTLEPDTKDVEQLDDGDTVPRYRWKIHYWRVNGMTNQWQKTSTWGGKLLQNATEGLCRDFLAGAMLRLEAHGYPMVLSVHDEAIADVPDGHGDKDEFMRLFEQVPSYAKGFPLKAEGGVGVRYAK